MVSKKAKSLQDMVRESRKGVKRFFIDDELHQILYVERPQDIMVAWNFPKGKRVGFVWSDAQRRMKKAYTMTEVGKLLNRHRVRIDAYIREGMVPPPQYAYSLDAERRKGFPYFSDKMILDIHEYLLTVHRGRKRMDGRITPQAMPTRLELKAMLQDGKIVYTKNYEGEFIPLWREQNW